MKSIKLKRSNTYALDLRNKCRINMRSRLNKSRIAGYIDLNRRSVSHCLHQLL